MKWDKEELKEYVNRSKSMSDLLRNMGLQIYNGNYRTAKKYIKIYNLDISHFTRKGLFNYVKNAPMPLTDVLTENSFVTSSKLKKRLINDDILKNVCSICGQQPEWNGKPLNLILDHINGNHQDNRLENLRIICRHCDSQLDTFAGKNIKSKANYICKTCGGRRKSNTVTGLCLSCYREQQKIKTKEKKDKILKTKNEIKKKRVDRQNENNICLNKQKFDICEKIKNDKNDMVKKCVCGKKIRKSSSFCKHCFSISRYKVKERPSKEHLLTMIKEKSLLQIGKQYGVSDNAIRKWLRKYGLPIKRIDIKNLK